MLEERIIALKRELIEYTILVESIIGKANRGSLEKEKEILLKAIDKDE